MTKSQRKDYKQANQGRKARILDAAKFGAPKYRGYWAHRNVGQNGKYTQPTA